jgi:hypothetical protein
MSWIELSRLQLVLFDPRDASGPPTKKDDFLRIGVFRAEEKGLSVKINDQLQASLGTSY